MTSCYCRIGNVKHLRIPFFCNGKTKYLIKYVSKSNQLIKKHIKNLEVGGINSSKIYINYEVRAYEESFTKTHTKDDESDVTRLKYLFDLIFSN